MKRTLKAALLLVALSTAAFAGTTPAAPAPDSPAVHAHKSAHQIGILAVMAGLQGHCSGSAIAPHAILTATHCSSPSAIVSIDGVDTDVLGTFGDGLDHTIILVRATFKDYVNIAPNTHLVEGDDVFVFGNPGDFKDMFRKGYVSGFLTPEPPDSAIEALLRGKQHPGNDNVRVTLYDLNGFFGDSGSAIFNTTGEVVGVTSFIDGNEANGYTLKFMGSYEMRFDPKMLSMAREFAPEPDKPAPVAKPSKSLSDWFKF